MANALVARPFKLFQRDARRAVRTIELLGAPASVPLRLEGRYFVTDLIKAHAIRSLVGTSIIRKLDRAARDDTGDNLSQVPNPIIMSGLAHIKRLIEHNVYRCLECGNESARDILN